MPIAITLILHFSNLPLLFGFFLWALILLPFIIIKAFTKFEVYLFFLVLTLILEKYSYYVGFAIRLPLIVIACTILFYLIRSLVIGRLRVEGKFLPLLALLYLNYWLGAIWATNPTRVIRVSILYFFLFALFLITLNTLQSHHRIRYAANCLIVVGCLGACYGFYQVIAFGLGWPTELPFTEYLLYHKTYTTNVTVFNLGGILIPRINSTFNDPVLIGSFSGVALMVMLSAYFFYYADGRLNKRLHVLYCSGLVLLSLCVLLTFSRSSWLGVIAGLGMFGVLLITGRRTHRLVRRVIVTGFFAFVAGLWFFPLLREIIIGRVSQIFDMTDRSTIGHMKWVKVALHAWSENPLFGVGLNNFGEFYAKKYQATSHAMTHSAYLSFVAENGLIGLFLEVSLIALILKLAFHALGVAKKTGNMYYKYLLIGLISGYTVILGSNLTYHFYTQFYVWFIKGLVVATASYVILQSKVESSPASVSRLA
ncbi:MAG: hypothetical protein GWN01_02315 [Nitrosopumilaceae archaeon]|nr:O-antigen ligase family protein [Nitrosopumilaceae archaeon]NIX60406.1 hypothetical protein [Nitrosopumilaceae archaeon]